MHRSDEDQESDAQLLEEYEHFLSGKAEGTVDAYLRTAHQIMDWIAVRPGNNGHFQPHQLTKTSVEMYLAFLEQKGYSINHRARVKSTISSFARWLMEEKGLLQRNPTRGVELPSQQMLAPRQQGFSQMMRRVHLDCKSSFMESRYLEFFLREERMQRVEWMVKESKRPSGRRGEA